MMYPPFLKPGDTIGVMSPSSYVEKEDIDAGVAVLEQRGFNVFVHPQTFERHNQSAGTHDQKIAALHALAADDKIKAVIFAGGGNRSLHILDQLDYKRIKRSPKIYMGFSDCTALLNAITAKCGFVTYHGPVLTRLPSNIQIGANFDLLEGKAKTIPLAPAHIIHEGRAKGPMFGGNLSLIRAMRKDDMIKARNSILFLEETGEELSKIDRDLTALRRSGIFNKISGLIFGQFSDMRDTGKPFGYTLEDIIREHTAKLGIPVLINAPFGHDRSLNFALPIGQRAVLDQMQITILP